MKTSSILKKLNRRDTRIIPKLPLYTKFALIIFALIGISLFSKTIFAQTNILKEKQDAITKGNNQESWINEALLSNLTSFQIMLGGTIPDTILNGETDPQGFPLTSYNPSGLIGGANNMIASTFTPAASGIEYIAMVKDNFLGIPAYAQSNGVGFNKLNKILPLWKAARNITYVLSSLIFVFIGIMIMLRVKVSPQAVISVQSSIPKIITALILITFSYAIAGLCIDFMNFTLAFMLSLIFNALGKDLSTNLFPLSWSDWSITNIINGIRGILGDNAFNFENLNNASFHTLTSIVTRITPTVAIAALGGLLGGIAGAFAGPVGMAIGGAGGALIFLVIIEILLFISLIKFLFALIVCYIKIILKIIVAPLEIAMGALPNSKNGFNTWLISLIANLAVFPFSILFLVIINILIDYVGLGLWTPMLLNGAASFFLPTMIGLTGVLLLPKLPPMITEFVFSIKPSPYGKAIGERLKPITNVGKLGATAVADKHFGVAEENYEAAAQGTAGPRLTSANFIGKALRHSGVLPRKR